MRRKSLLYLAISVSIVIASAIIVVTFSRNYVIQQAEIRIREVLLEANSLHNYVQNNMHPTMYELKKEGRMPESFYSPEILSSSYISRHIFQHFNKDRAKNNLPEISYRIAAKNPRNLVNKADSTEAALVDMFNNDRTLKKYTGIVKEDGIKYLYYAQPFLSIEQKCLKCHGTKEEAPHELRTYYNWNSGFNWEVGTIPAVEIIKTPLVGEFKTSSKIMAGIVFTAAVILTLILFLSWLRRLNRKRTEEKLKAEENYHQLFNNAGDPILIIDLNDLIIEANVATQKLLGFKEEALINIPVSKLFDAKNTNKAEERLEQIKNENDLLYETVFVSSEMQEIPCEVNAALIPYNNDKAILYSIRDISLRKKHEKELEDHRNNLENKVEERTAELKNAQSQLVHSEKMASLGVLTAGIAHEINNPLNYIMGSYVGLNKYFENQENNNEKNISILLDCLKTGVDRASNIVKGLNQLSHTSSTHDEICDINSILDNCSTILHNQMKHKVEVVKNYDENLSEIKGNVGNLHQIFINLLTNATQSIENKGRISIATQQQQQNIQIEISDTGCGIKKEYIHRITEPFFTTKEPGQGTGLGLSISYNLIREHAGEMSFESSQGEGTKVIITLPNNSLWTTN